MSLRLLAIIYLSASIIFWVAGVQFLAIILSASSTFCLWVSSRRAPTPAPRAEETP
jgi:hypothetical protein